MLLQLGVIKIHWECQIDGKRVQRCRKESKIQFGKFNAYSELDFCVEWPWESKGSIYRNRMGRYNSGVCWGSLMRWALENVI